MKRRWLSVLLLILILLGVAAAGKRLYTLGEFKEMTFHQPGPCEPVLGVYSSEDIVISGNLALISSDRRRGPLKTEELTQGTIFGYSLTERPMQPTDLIPNFEEEFHPHGLGLLEVNGEDLLFVVNHRSSGDFVEVFEISGGKLTHLESIPGNQLNGSANDIVPVGERSFYVTIDHGSRSEWGRWLEEVLGLAWSKVAYFDGEGYRTVAEGISYANGINISPNGGRIYVGASAGLGVHVFVRDPETGELTEKEFLELGSGVDNIEVDGEGTLWVGAHPKILTFIRYAENRKVRSPSQVFRIDRREDSGGYSVSEVYLSSGEYLSGSSVAVPWQDSLLIGSVFDERFLVCEMEAQSRRN